MEYTLQTLITVSCFSLLIGLAVGWLIFFSGEIADADMYARQLSEAQLALYHFKSGVMAEKTKYEKHWTDNLPLKVFVEVSAKSDPQYPKLVMEDLFVILREINPDMTDEECALVWNEMPEHLKQIYT